ncbi:MAG: type II toxin-antitoxin system mRNA interferase toxin, RelE/StbE family [Rivularia sp. (in: cyanobacteria)]
MITLIWGTSFKRAFKRIVRKNPQLEEKILTVLELLSNDPFTNSLKSHKLRGQLERLWACSVEYDCRIIYTFEQDSDNEEEIILLVNIGTHDEVY